MATGFPTKANWAAGDILTASAMDDLAGTVNLLTNSSASTGQYLVSNAAGTSFVYNNNFAAGKNKIINGDFNVWQRGTSFTPAASGNQVFTADRFSVFRDGSGTVTVSQQTFTPGTAPVSGYEGQYYLRFAQSVAGSGETYSVLEQRIEDVRSFAGQTITLSFWAKGAAGATLAAPSVVQYFGSGGSGTVYTVIGTSQTLTTSWQRFSFTGTVPSVSGKTIGTGSSLGAAIALLCNTAFTWDFWGVQVEAGSVATAFQTATGTFQGELAACQRYYFRNVASPTSFASLGGAGWYTSSTTSTSLVMTPPVTMRSAPSSVEYGGTVAIMSSGATTTNISALTLNQTTANVIGLTATATCVIGTVYTLAANNSSTAYVGVSAELQEMTVDNVTFIKLAGIDGVEVEHAIIDRGNGEFTSMPKAVYEAQQATTKAEK